jgi:hypothetical protein
MHKIKLIVKMIDFKTNRQKQPAIYKITLKHNINSQLDFKSSAAKQNLTQSRKSAVAILYFMFKRQIINST